jgi:hypothetical protein
MPPRRAGSPLLWLHRGQDRHRRLKSAQDMLAERVPRARGCASEGSGGEQWVAQLFRQILHSNDLVDRGPNQRELQPLGHSDIAIDNLAQVERNAEIECYVGRCRLRGAESPARFLGCGERPSQRILSIKLGAPKGLRDDQRETRPCPSWVKSWPDSPEVQLPLCSRKRTQVGHRAMSGSCQRKSRRPIRPPRRYGEHLAAMVIRAARLAAILLVYFSADGLEEDKSKVATFKQKTGAAGFVLVSNGSPASRGIPEESLFDDLIMESDPMRAAARAFAALTGSEPHQDRSSPA